MGGRGELRQDGRTSPAWIFTIPELIEYVSGIFRPAARGRDPHRHARGGRADRGAGQRVEVEVEGTGAVRQPGGAALSPTAALRPSGRRPGPGVGRAIARVERRVKRGAPQAAPLVVRTTCVVGEEPAGVLRGEAAGVQPGEVGALRLPVADAGQLAPYQVTEMGRVAAEVRLGHLREPGAAVVVRGRRGDDPGRGGLVRGEPRDGCEAGRVGVVRDDQLGALEAGDVPALRDRRRRDRVARRSRRRRRRRGRAGGWSRARVARGSRR